MSKLLKAMSFRLLNHKSFKLLNPNPVNLGPLFLGRLRGRTFEFLVFRNL